MEKLSPYHFKIATEEEEFEAIHRLNYRTFVEEIPQHAPAAVPRLVDKFHAQNTYIVCRHENRLVGMVAFRGQRPFSLDEKLPHLDARLPIGRRPCELRLLAVEPTHRHGVVLRGLIGFVANHARAQGHDLAVISGTTRQLKLYRHLGFEPFGPLVGGPNAQFQPMLLTLENFVRKERGFMPPAQRSTSITAPANFLTGPVEVLECVRAAFSQPPVSHRAAPFLHELEAVVRQLCGLTNAGRVGILVGSGTLANDVVGGQLKLEPASGLVLSNGEFGERLIDHARRWKLTFETHRLAWGRPFDLAAVAAQLDQRGKTGWLWAVHSETSTGMLNDLNGLKRICAERGIKLCLDCISSLGTVPVDLCGVTFAAGVSGKGFAAYPGLALVFHHHPIPPSPDQLPRYLDLGFAANEAGVYFTHSSNLISALLAALRRLNESHFAGLIQAGTRLRRELRAAGFEIISPEEHATPAVVTLALPPTLDSLTVGRRLEQAGYLVGHASEYLRRRNWLQICLMGCWAESALTALLSELGRIRATVSSSR